MASQDPKLGDQDGLDVLIEADKIVAVERDIQAADAHEIDASGSALSGLVQVPGAEANPVGLRTSRTLKPSARSRPRKPSK